MGLFRRKGERAIPEPGTPEFDAAVQESALRDEQTVSMGQEGWTRPAPEAEGEEQGEQPKRPRRQRALGALGRTVLKPPNTGGFGAGIPKKKKPRD